MPFINVKVAGEPLEQHQVADIQKGITSLMADVLNKVGPLVGVLVEQVPAAGWSVGAEPITRAAQVDAIVSAGTNTPEQKATFIAETITMLKSILGPDLSEITYVVIHDVPGNSWGYDGLTQEHRAKQRQSA